MNLKSTDGQIDRQSTDKSRKSTDVSDLVARGGRAQSPDTHPTGRSNHPTADGMRMTPKEEAHRSHAAARRHQQGLGAREVHNITVTRDEILCSLTKPEVFILAIAEFQDEARDNVHYLRQPFRSEHAFGATSVNYDLTDLTLRASAPI